MKHYALATADRWNGCEDQNGKRWCNSARCSTFRSAVHVHEDQTQHRSMRQLGLIDALMMRRYCYSSSSAGRPLDSGHGPVAAAIRFQDSAFRSTFARRLTAQNRSSAEGSDVCDAAAQVSL